MVDRAHWPIFEARGYHVTPVHFYEPIPNLSELEFREPIRFSTEGLDLGEPEQRRLVAEISRYFDEFEWEANTFFSRSDSLVLYGMIRQLRPNRVIEVGCGYSTNATLAAIERNGTGELITIEPFEQERMPVRPAYTVPVQEVPLDLFTTLSENDVLFIDSSHVAKTGSDVNHLFLNVLPALAPGVVVHVHDIFLPDDYPADWVRERHRFWNEQYLLHAFLAFNSEWRVLLSVHQLAAASLLGPAADGASFWMRRGSCCRRPISTDAGDPPPFCYRRT
jgi:predicted O-methyltransferase YrrM